jgi:hypothetical protein
MTSYAQAAVERAMKIQEVILRAVAVKMHWFQAAEILGISPRQMHRWQLIPAEEEPLGGG